MSVDINENLIVGEDISITNADRVEIIINNSDKTRYVEVNSLICDNILTRQVDTCQLSIKKVVDGSILNYKPQIGHNIVVKKGGVKIFGGVILKITQRLDGNKILVYDLNCEDYTRFLKRHLVAGVYENMTVNAIIENIRNTYLLLDEITINNVDCDVIIDYFSANYLDVNQVLQRLADLVSYDWYIDYEKDIHFFAKDTTPAPFEITDTNSSYLTNSLVIQQDNSQVRNVIIVRGGEFVGATLTSEIVADGSQTIFNLGYKFAEGLEATLSGNPLSIGVDGLDKADDFDVLWNFNDKVFKFKDADKPNIDKILKLVGQPYFPVRVKQLDNISIANMKVLEGGSGQYEYLIIDNSIKTKQGAIERALSELESYKATLNEGSFDTYNDGLRAGQVLTINSSIHDINQSFIINKVTARMWTNNKMIYTINLVTTKTFGIIEYLQSQLTAENSKIIINENEIIDLIEGEGELLDIEDTFTAQTSHNLQTESISVSETFTAQSLDYVVEWVYGKYSPPVGNKREALFDSAYWQ